MSLLHWTHSCFSTMTQLWQASLQGLQLSYHRYHFGLPQEACIYIQNVHEDHLQAKGHVSAWANNHIQTDQNVKCLTYIDTCKYVHTSSHERAEAEWIYSGVTVAHKNNSERRSKRYEERQAWQCKNSNAKSYSLHLSKHFILYSTSWQLVAIICFCLSCNERRHLKTPSTLTREACLLSAGLFFCLWPDRWRYTSLTQLQLPWLHTLLLAWDWQRLQIENREGKKKKHDKNIVFRVTQRDHKHVMCSKKPGPR